MRLRSFIAISLLFSSIVSINKLFENVKSPESPNDSLFKYEYPMFAFALDSFTAKGWLKTFSIIHYTFNDVVLFLVQMIIDILLVIQIKKDLHMKKQSLKTLLKSKQDESSKKLEYLSHVSQEANRMILYFLVLNAFFRLPEFSLNIYLNAFFVPEFKPINELSSFSWLCYNQLCILLIFLIQFIYLLSYSSYIFFYFKYNKSFRNGFWQFFFRSQKKL